MMEGPVGRQNGREEILSLREEWRVRLENEKRKLKQMRREEEIKQQKREEERRKQEKEEIRESIERGKQQKLLHRADLVRRRYAELLEHFSDSYFGCQGVFRGLSESQKEALAEMCEMRCRRGLWSAAGLFVPMLFMKLYAYLDFREAGEFLSCRRWFRRVENNASLREMLQKESHREWDCPLCRRVYKNRKRYLY